MKGRRISEQDLILIIYDVCEKRTWFQDFGFIMVAWKCRTESKGIAVPAKVEIFIPEVGLVCCLEHNQVHASSLLPFVSPVVILDPYVRV